MSSITYAMKLVTMEKATYGILTLETIVKRYFTRKRDKKYFRLRF